MDGADRPATPGRAAVARRWWPWLVTAAVLALLAWRVSLPALGTSLAQAPLGALGGWVAATTALTLLLDGWATRRALAVCGFTRPLAEVINVRGGTYLLGLVSYAAGQGGLGYYAHRLGAGRGRALGVVGFLLMVNVWALVVAAAFGLVLTPRSLLPLAQPKWLALLAAAAAAGYLALVSVRWPPLRRWPPLASVLEPGAHGHLAAAAPRVLHVLVLVVALWGGLRLWGIPVPFSAGLGGVPLVLLAAALPVTPGGLGLT